MKTKSILQLLNESKIVIPPIQRDYAQGRQTGRIPKIRGRFLDDIVAVLKDDKLPPLDLDFIYGYVEKHRLVQNEITEFKPLDGQQRLTTLFLVHWYIAHKPGELEADKLKEAKELLVKFTYATRKSTRDFCQELIAFTPHFDFDSVDKEIIDQPWFMSIWQSDPSILSMLIVLRDIEYKFKGLEKVWEKLTGDQPRIIFHHLPMDDLV